MMELQSVLHHLASLHVSQLCVTTCRQTILTPIKIMKEYEHEFVFQSMVYVSIYQQ